MNNKSAVLRLKVSCLFFLSGMAGLIYELIWINRFGRLFGNSSYAIGTVLAAYMGGLALGSWLIGRRSDSWTNELRAYAVLELLVAGMALMVIPALWLLRPLYMAVSSFQSHAVINSCRLLTALLVLLPPTICMGGTLPVLVRFWTRRQEEAGHSLGMLYALNTFGAVAGCLAGGLVLLPYLGEGMAMWIAMAINLAVAAFAWLWSRSPAAVFDAEADTVPDSENSAERLDVSSIAFLAALAVAGFGSMGLELAWSRVIALVVGSSVYAFTAMLSVFLVGLAIGGGWGGSLLRRRLPGNWGFVAAEMMIAAWLIITIPFYDRLATFVGLFNQAARGHFNFILVTVFLACIFIVIVPAICMGMTIPFVMQAIRKHSRIGRYTGVVYASNTLGGIAGSLLCGFLLLPLLGIQNILKLCLTLNLAAGLLAALAPASRKNAAAFAVTAAVMLMLMFSAWRIPGWDPSKIAMGAFLYGPGGEHQNEIVFYRDGVSCTTTVEKDRLGTYSLCLNGKADASTGSADMPTQLMCGYLPLSFNPGARRVLILGYGSGVSAGAALQFPVAVIECAELEKAVVEADPYFNEVNHTPLKDPRLQILIEDGRNVIEMSREAYDVIISEPSNPWMAGVANLFTREYYTACLNKLNSGGIMLQWVQAYGTSVEDFKSICATFGSIFPHHALYRITPGDYFILGSDKPLTPDFAAIQELVAGHDIIRTDITKYFGTDNMTAILMRGFMFDGDVYDEFSRGANRIFRDARNTLGFSSVRNVFRSMSASIAEVDVAVHGFKKAFLPAGLMLEAADKQHEISDALVAIGNSCLQAGNTEVALRAFRTAAVANSENATAHSGLLISELVSGHVIDLPLRINQIAAADVDIAYETCRKLFELGQMPAAEMLLKQLVLQNPSSATLHVKLAGALLNMGRVDMAVVMLNKAIEIDPVNTDVIAATRLFQTYLQAR